MEDFWKRNSSEKYVFVNEVKSGGNVVYKKVFIKLEILKFDKKKWFNFSGYNFGKNAFWIKKNQNIQFTKFYTNK